MRVKYLIIAWVLFVIAHPIDAGLIVNEVLVNEPGGDVTLEWFELFNDSTGAVNIDDFTIEHAGDTISFLQSYMLTPGEYAVVTRNAAGFENHFGDSSDTWGDGPSEQYALLDGGFSFTNQPGSLMVISPTGDSSILSWADGGADGVSWERRLGDQALQSLAARGSTPGKLNSVTPLNHNLALTLDSTARTANGANEIYVTITNIGLTPLLSGCVNLVREPVIDSVGDSLLGEIVECVNYPALDTAVSAQIALTFFGMVRDIELGVDIAVADDRPGDDYAVFKVRGAAPSPVILSEFLANPESPIDGEWIEIHNVSNDVISLVGWMIGDALGSSEIPSALTIAPDERIVLVEDAVDFYSSYLTPGITVAEVAPWHALNNGSDTVRLIDELGYFADQFGYDEGFEENHTWALIDSGKYAGEWGRSAKPTGSPGFPNNSVALAEGEELIVSVAPNPFSPDGDGFEDEITITVQSPTGEELLARIYDREGRMVRELERSSPFSGTVNWDGMLDNGNRAPIGAYILLVTVDDENSYKTVVAVAR